MVCAGIHMSEIPAFPYDILWGERKIVSVANLTRRDGEEFLRLAPQVPVRTAVETFPLAQANEALARVREGRINGAAVLVTLSGAMRSSTEPSARGSRRPSRPTGAPLRGRP